VLYWLSRNQAEEFYRLDIVEDLMKNFTFEETFEGLVKGLPDLERLVARIHAKRCKVKEFIKVMATFDELRSNWSSLTDKASELASPHILHILQSSPDLAESLQEVNDHFTTQSECSSIFRYMPESKRRQMSN
jgi:DNA mismatch repair protein MSH6